MLVMIVALVADRSARERTAPAPSISSRVRKVTERNGRGTVKTSV
jgi:hypothetical protein